MLIQSIPVVFPNGLNNSEELLKETQTLKEELQKEGLTPELKESFRRWMDQIIQFCHVTETGQLKTVIDELMEKSDLKARESEFVLQGFDFGALFTELGNMLNQNPKFSLRNSERSIELPSNYGFSLNFSFFEQYGNIYFRSIQNSLARLRQSWYHSDGRCLLP